MRYLFLRIDSTATEANWQLVDKGKPVGPIGRGRVTDAARAARYGHVVVLLPSEDIFLTRLALPGKNRQKLLKALPFAIEDQLVDEIDNLHFALGSKAADDKYLVASVEQKMLDYWQSQLRAAGMHVEAMIPDVLALPESPAWTVLLEPDRGLVRSPAGMFASDINNLPLLLGNLVEQAGQQRPEHITVYDCGRANHMAMLQALTSGLSFNIQPCSDGIFGLVAEHYQPRTSLSLLQGDYSVERNLRKYFKPWLTAGSLFLVWAAWQLSYSVFEYLRLNQQSQTLTAQLVQLHKMAFPASKKPGGISERADMERRMKELRKQQGSSGAGLPEMMVKVAPLLKQTQGLNLKAVRFIDGKMDLHFSVRLGNQIEPLIEQLGQHTGFSVEITNRTTKGDVTDIVLKLQSKSA